MIRQAAIGLATGAIVAWFGHRSRFLSWTGALAVIASSGLVFAAATWVWGAPLLAAVLSTNLWALYGSQQKRDLGARFQSGTTRRVDQVVARLGWATLMALLYGTALGGSSRGLFGAYVGALAASTADAWATEIGVLAKTRPYSLVKKVRVPAGTPGAVSLLGLVAATLGAWLQGLLMLLGTSLRASIESVPRDASASLLPLAATLGGLAGCLADSLLGATAQGIYYCEDCQEVCEERQHTCGRQAQQIRGWAWLTNDSINLVASVVGAAVTVVVYIWLARFRAGW